MALPEGKMLNEDMTELIDIPVEEKKSKAEQEETEEEVDDVEDAKKREPKKEKKEEKEEEEEEKPKEEPEPTPEEEEAPKEGEEEEEEEVELTLDEYIAQTYADYGVESEEDLGTVLGTIKEIEDENNTLKAELETLKNGKPKFDSELQEKAFNFIEKFDPDRFGEGMQTYHTLITLDLDKADPRILLEEQFINENPELTREEALRKFNKDYKRKYEAKPDDFEDDESYKDALADLKIDLKADAAKAKRYLAQKQKEFTPKPKEADSKKAEVQQTIQQSIKAIDSELDEFMGEFNTIIFSPTDNEKDDFSYKLSKEQLQKVHTATKAWIGNPNSYDGKGNLLGWTDADSKVQEVSYLLFGPDMIAKAYHDGLSKGEIKRAEQIASKKPDRVAKVASTADADNGEQQWEELANKKAAEREKRRYA